MRSTVLLVAALMGVLCCGCDIFAPPEPDYSRADRQIEALMGEIEKLRESSGTAKEAAYQALIRELNECAVRLEKCEGPPAKAESSGRTKLSKPSKTAPVPADLESPFD